MIRPVPKPKNYCRCGCGTEIKATRKWVSGHNLRRRPKGAIVKKGRSYVYVDCDGCDGKALKRTDLVNRRNNKNYCSRSCANKANAKIPRSYPERKTGEYRNCIQCREEFYVNRYRVIHKNPKYCSRKCQTDRQRERGIVPKNLLTSTNNKGKNNGMYKHGKYKRRGRPSRVKLRKKIIERDGGNWCLFCGTPGPGLHLHRIKYGAQGGKYVLDNVVQLCPHDHALVHTSKKTWKPILEEYIKTKKLKLPREFYDDLKRRMR